MSDSLGFAYFTEVQNNSTEWPLHKRDDPSQSFAIVGSLSVSDADPPANSNTDRPWVLRSRFTLRAGAQSSFFHLDRNLMSAFRAGDTVHIACTARGGVGVAVLRDGQLVVAVGVVSAVPLGRDVSVRVAPELWEQAVSTPEFHPGVIHDPRQTYRDLRPLEILIAGDHHLFFSRNETIHGVHVFVKHGFYIRSPQPSAPTPEGRATGTDECVALARISLASKVTATTSAFLLAADGLVTGP